MKIRYTCLLSIILLLHNSANAQENCSNGKDDDGDGLIDLKDNECTCKDSIPVLNYFNNPSFEDYEICPKYGLGDGLGLNHFPYWSTAPASGNVGYFNLNCTNKYYDTLQPHYPLPDGTGYILIQNNGDIAYGNKYYAATCLKNTLKANHKYTFECYIGYSANDKYRTYFKNATRLTLFGSADCGGVQFTNYISMGCPTIVSEYNHYKDWVQLGTASVFSPDGNWTKVRIDFVPPIDVNLFLVGPDCALLGNGNSEYFYADMFTLSEEENFSFKTIAVSNDCVHDILLTAPATANATYQWYKDSIAIAGATKNTYTVLRTATGASYNVRMQYDAGCILSSAVRIDPGIFKKLSLGQDTTLCVGTSVLLKTNIPDMRYTWQDGSTNTAFGVNVPGNYSLTVTDNYGCSATDNIKIDFKDCIDCPVLLPSAFTPNNDGNNDVFKVLTNCALIKNFHLSIYNKLGQNIFETSNTTQGWNGLYKNKLVETGVYVYVLQYRKYSSNKIITTKGTVTVLR